MPPTRDRSSSRLATLAHVLIASGGAPVIPSTGGRCERYLSDDPLPRRPERVVLDGYTTRLKVRSPPRVPWLPESFYD